MKNFGIEFNGKYLVVIKGTIVKKSFFSRSLAERWWIRYSCNRKNYVTLWYQGFDGECHLCEF